MHPDIVRDTPGRCTRCGMPLVAHDSMKPVVTVRDDQGLGRITWHNYMPLVVVIGLITLSAGIVSSSLYAFILAFMTGFFLVFAGFKLMDLGGFAHGYATYDLLAQRWFGYGYIYPFIELAFGLLMLAGYHPNWLLWTEAGIMVFSGLGVAIKLARREPFMCACLGTFLKVPLTSVTLVEDFGMAVLAIALIFLG